MVLSDVHLSQAHPEDPSDPLWMRYRRAAHHPDEDFASLVDDLLATRGGDAIEVVWNGDVFDFDAPWVKDGQSSFDEFPLDEAGCAAHLRRILADHPGWVRAAGRLLAAGHRLLVLSGNHDVELYWPAVRRALRGALREASGLDAAAVAERVRFRAWFHVTEDGIYLEHGSQYDRFSSLRWPMIPLTRARALVQPQLGKLAFKRTGGRMGYFNPYCEETFNLGLAGYLRHWRRFYVRSRRSLVRTWLGGGLRAAADLLQSRHGEDWSAENRALCCAETGATPDTVDRALALAARPLGDALLPVLRELWFDRLLLLAAVPSLGALAFALGGPRPALLSLGAAAAAVAGYERSTPPPSPDSHIASPHAAAAIFAIHGVRAVCLGHTHRPAGVWENGRFLGNSGAWCPAFHDPQCLSPVLSRRPLILLTSEAGALSGGLSWWDGRALARE